MAVSSDVQQLLSAQAVAKPSVASTLWPGVVKVRNAAATATKISMATILFMTVSCQHSAVPAGARIGHGEAEGIQHAVARRREPKKRRRSGNHDQSRNGLLHDPLP